MPSSAPITCRCRAMAPAAADGARRRAAGRRTWLHERSPRPRLGSTSPPSNPTEMSMTATPNPAKVSVSWEEFAPGCQGSRLAPPGTWPVEGDGGCNARGIGAGGDRRPRARHKVYRNRMCDRLRTRRLQSAAGERDHSHQASPGCWRWRRLAGGGRSHRYRPHRQGAP